MDTKTTNFLSIVETMSKKSEIVFRKDTYTLYVYKYEDDDHELNINKGQDKRIRDLKVAAKEMKFTWLTGSDIDNTNNTNSAGTTTGKFASNVIAGVDYSEMHDLKAKVDNIPAFHHPD